MPIQNLPGSRLRSYPALGVHSFTALSLATLFSPHHPFVGRHRSTFQCFMVTPQSHDVLPMAVHRPTGHERCGGREARGPFKTNRDNEPVDNRFGKDMRGLTPTCTVSASFD
jgi:hypothetical protein